jgi:hypothetical protein
MSDNLFTFGTFTVDIQPAKNTNVSQNNIITVNGDYNVPTGYTGFNSFKVNVDQEISNVDNDTTYSQENDAYELTSTAAVDIQPLSGKTGLSNVYVKPKNYNEYSSNNRLSLQTNGNGVIHIPQNYSGLGPIYYNVNVPSTPSPSSSTKNYITGFIHNGGVVGFESYQGWKTPYEIEDWDTGNSIYLVGLDFGSNYDTSQSPEKRFQLVYYYKDTTTGTVSIVLQDFYLSLEQGGGMMSVENTKKENTKANRGEGQNTDYDSYSQNSAYFKVNIQGSNSNLALYKYYIIDSNYITSLSLMLDNGNVFCNLGFPQSPNIGGETVKTNDKDYPEIYDDETGTSSIPEVDPSSSSDTTFYENSGLEFATPQPAPAEVIEATEIEYGYENSTGTQTQLENIQLPASAEYNNNNNMVLGKSWIDTENKELIIGTNVNDQVNLPRTYYKSGKMKYIKLDYMYINTGWVYVYVTFSDGVGNYTYRIRVSDIEDYTSPYPDYITNNNNQGRCFRIPLNNRVNYDDCVTDIENYVSKNQIFTFTYRKDTTWEHTYDYNAYYKSGSLGPCYLRYTGGYNVGNYAPFSGGTLLYNSDLNKLILTTGSKGSESQAQYYTSYSEPAGSGNSSLYIFDCEWSDWSNAWLPTVLYARDPYKQGPSGSDDPPAGSPVEMQFTFYNDEDRTSIKKQYTLSNNNAPSGVSTNETQSISSSNIYENWYNINIDYSQINQEIETIRQWLIPLFTDPYGYGPVNRESLVLFFKPLNMF